MSDVGDTQKAQDRSWWMSDTFGCQVTRILYDFTLRAGVIEMPPLNCTDMASAIRLFERIDPEVQTIRTVTNEPSSNYDTSYVKEPTGWKARRGAE